MASTYTLQLAKEAGPDPYVWQDISEYLLDAQWSRGRDDTLLQTQPLTASVTLLNDDGRFSPRLSTSPLFGYVKQMRAVRLRWSSSAYKSYDAEVMADSPGILWRFGEPSGTTAEDSSGNARDGTYTGPTLAQTGALAGDIDTCIDFDGSDDYVTSSDALFTIATLTAFSIGVWVYIDSTNTEGGIRRTMWHIRDDANNRALLTINPTGGVHVQADVRKSSVNYTRRTTLGGIATGAWYHIVVTWDGAASPSIYVNSAVDNAASPAIVADSGTVTKLIVGARDSAGAVAGAFDGKMDEFAFFTTSLSATRIAAHYNAGINTLRGCFLGYIVDAFPKPRPEDSVCVLTLTDASTRLALAKTTPVYSNQRSDLDIGVALDSGSWPARLRNLSSGKSTFQPAYTDTEVLTQVNQIGVDNEGGLTYVDEWGRVTFEDRHYRLLTSRCTTSQYTFTDTNGLLDLLGERQSTDVRNQVKITYTGGGTVTVSDTPSDTEYGTRRLDLTAAFLAAGEATDRANYELSKRKDEFDRPIVPLANIDAAIEAQLHARRISDRITINDATGISGFSTSDFFIEAETHRLEEHGFIHNVEWQLTEVDAVTYWILGVVGYSELGLTTVLGY